MQIIDPADYRRCFVGRAIASGWHGPPVFSILAAHCRYRLSRRACAISRALVRFLCEQRQRLAAGFHSEASPHVSLIPGRSEAIRRLVEIGLKAKRT
jgi:hypothetical protein